VKGSKHSNFITVLQCNIITTGEAVVAPAVEELSWDRYFGKEATNLLNSRANGIAIPRCNVLVLHQIATYLCQ
jgi:hypothetical protein